MPALSVVDVIRAARFPFGDEDQLQAGIAAALGRAGFALSREYRLTARDRIDLFVTGGVGVEVKIAGAAGNVQRQLRRYSEHPLIKELVLVTRCARHTAAATLNGKPVTVINLAGAGL